MVIENSFDNIEVIKINYKDRSIYLGSKYNMRREIENFRNKFLPVNKNYKIIIFGSSGGKWIYEYIDEFKERDIIFIEPTKELKEILEENISKTNLNIKVLSLDSNSFKNELKNSIDKRFIEFIIFSNYDLVFPNDVYNLKEMIKDYVMDKTINENTRIVFSKDWFENYIYNLPSVLIDEKLDEYKNVYKDKPAIIVSAGPSLEKNINLLKGNEDNFIIITGIRTLSTLQREGIKCDFACVIDGSEAMYKVSKEALNYDTPLFYSEGANKNIIKEYKGKKIYFSSPTFYQISCKLGDFKTDLLYQGGSVAHSCTAIAHYLGCNPIIFIGQDLAYTNNQIHAKNATIEGEKIQPDKYDLFVKDIYGNEVPTSYGLDSFRKSFEEFIKHFDDRTYINATEGGANIEGTKVMKLSEVIEQFKDNKIDKSYIKQYKKRNEDIALVIKNLKENLNELIKAKKMAEEAVFENKNLLYKYYNDYKSYRKSLKKLDYIDEKFNKKQREFLLINTLFAPIIKEIDIAFYDKKIGNFNDEVEHIKFVAEKGKVLYENINSCIEYALPHIEEIIKKLEELINESK
ncbi:motility associated factor glycosyltransferase family protein [Caloramator sp. E03]|uniref:motility associated factor glycosyltransferase family protein n=1 Tax=Caloramator sp. E03 TaxID=2576307 RepID=UPI0011102715|nr:6-hydroxymethylpterin diphosphokinase MptE-like protein [Caloramator sp. E03]QCX32368.1 motility associated factor glycosyltransferase family protein [Caloramator sp. E03]